MPMKRADSQLVLTDVHFRYWPGAQNGTLDRILLPVQRHPCPARLTYLHDIPAGGQRRQRTLRGRASDASGDPALSGGGVDSSMGMGYVVLLCTIMFSVRGGWFCNSREFVTCGSVVIAPGFAVHYVSALHGSSNHSKHFALAGVFNHSSHSDGAECALAYDDFDDRGDDDPPEFDDAIANAIARGGGQVTEIIASDPEARCVFTDLVTIAKQLAEMASNSIVAHGHLQGWLTLHCRAIWQQPATQTYTAWLRVLEDTFVLRVAGWLMADVEVHTASTQLKADLETLCGFLRDNSPSDSTAQQSHSKSC